MTAKKKMSPLQLSLIVHTLFSYLSLITTLPITSKPLENNPEHLTWEAWLMIDSKNPHEKTRKITPKSIFITPNLTNTTASVTCPDGYKVDQNNQCIQIVNIDPDDELLNHLESLLGPSEGHEGDVSYDYSDYDSTAVHAGPFQLNIPLNIGFNSGDSNQDDNLKGDFDYDYRDGDHNPRPDVSVKPFREPAPTNDNSNDKLSVKPISTKNEIFVSTTNRMGAVTNTEMATTTDTVPEIETTTLLFEQIRNHNKTDKNIVEDSSTIEMIDNGGSNDNVRMEPLKQGNENIAAELQKESFLFDVNDTTATTTTTSQQATTLMVADDDGFTTEESTSIETTTDVTTTVKSVTKKKPPTTTRKSSTKEPVVVVTPSNRDTLKVENESNLDKITREKLEKHEQKEDAIENIDTRNRFVYHHLGNEAPKFQLKKTEPPLWHSLLQSSTTTDKTLLEEKINDQVKAITRIIEENNRMKFPTASEPSSTVNGQIDKRQNGFVRFPGPTSQRLMTSTMNTSPPTDAESNAKWWLSSNWSDIESNYDRLQQQPTPASSAASLSSTPFWKFSTKRGNSKSPTEHLYEEQRYNHDPIYRVLTSKSLQHHHNNR